MRLRQRFVVLMWRRGCSRPRRSTIHSPVIRCCWARESGQALEPGRLTEKITPRCPDVDGETGPSAACHPAVHHDDPKACLGTSQDRNYWRAVHCGTAFPRFPRPLPVDDSDSSFCPVHHSMSNLLWSSGEVCCPLDPPVGVTVSV